MADTLKEVHEELLILLERLHAFCKENHIRYSLHGGTMLGAVREHGFIPWDDDADVTFARDQFDRFVPLAREAFCAGDVRFDEDSRYPKLVMMRTGRPVVWIDFFVYDYITDVPLLRKLKLWGTQFFILMTRTKEEQALSNSHGVHGRLGKLGMSVLVALAAIVPFRCRLHLARRFMTAFPGKRRHVHRSNDTNRGMKMILPAGVLDAVIPVSFAGRQFDVYEDYDTVLRASYGPNYMVPLQDKPAQTHEVSLQKEREYFVNKFFAR